MVRRMRILGKYGAGAFFAAALLTRSAASAQDGLTLDGNILLYGDNTEMRNPFREGETMFGAAARLEANVGVAPRASVALGVFANQRFGSGRAFEIVRPVVALTITGRRSSFVFGTLPPRGADAPIGPDRAGLHRLLPPLQRETLAFDRPYEAGLAWSFRGSVLRHEAWIEWQRLNTPEHRERFDAGLNAEVQASRAVSIPLQLHVVHQGGQLFASGPVTDSLAAAAGVKLERGLRGGRRASAEAYGVLSHDTPDRAAPGRSLNGTAFLARAAIEQGGWRTHLVVWRGRDFVKEEGDLNYGALRRNSTYHRGTRDYAEMGASRRFRLSPAAYIEVSGRLHRVERYYEYSYRVTSSVDLSTRVR